MFTDSLMIISCLCLQIFMVRRSSKDAMAMSMRVGAAPCIEHYLIQTDTRGLKLEGSVLSFSALPLLINHYYHSA